MSEISKRNCEHNMAQVVVMSIGHTSTCGYQNVILTLTQWKMSGAMLPDQKGGS